MTVEIDDPELEVEVRRLAEACGRPVEAVVRESLKAGVAHQGAGSLRKIDLESIRRIQEEVARLPVLDSRSADEILGYNESGHFD